MRQNNNPGQNEQNGNQKKLRIQKKASFSNIVDTSEAKEGKKRKSSKRKSSLIKIASGALGMISKTKLPNRISLNQKQRSNKPSFGFNNGVQNQILAMSKKNINVEFEQE